jgi:hypothetical protein
MMLGPDISSRARIFILSGNSHQPNLGLFKATHSRDYTMWMVPAPSASKCAILQLSKTALEELPMQVTTIGLDLAKNVFQVHGITDDGNVAFNRALRRAQVLPFLRSLNHAL